MLRWRDPGFLRGALAPAKELAKSGPELEEACVVNLWLVGSGPITWGLRALSHDPIVARRARRRRGPHRQELATANTGRGFRR